MRLLFLGTLGALLLAAAAPGEPTARFPRGMAPMELGPPPAGLPDWSQARCEGCHAEEAGAWGHSGHATARTNLVFRSGIGRDDPAWCVGCHAPLARDRSAAPVAESAPAEEKGVTCAACHAGHGAVLSRRPAPEAPHAIEVMPELASSERCAGCHQFGFAVRDAHGKLARLSQTQLQQDTWGEWARYQARSGDSRSCAACHMAQGDHAFGGTHRVEALRGAVQVEPAPDGQALLVRTREVGHRLPTGDVMRWLTLEAAADPLFEQPLEVGRFGRSLGLRPWDEGWPAYLGAVEDTRLSDPASGPVRVALPRADAQGRPLAAWRLIYHLISPNQEAEGVLPPEVSRIVLQAGELPAGGKP